MTNPSAEFTEPLTTEPTAGASGAATADGPSGASARDVARVLLRRPLALGGLLVIAAMVVLALFGTLIAPSGENDVDVSAMLTGPSAAHWFGTDELGRDVLSRVIIAAHASMEVSAVSVGIALAVGVLLGLLAGYYRRFADSLIMRCMDVLFAFPVMLLAIAIVAVLGAGIGSAMIAIAVVYTPIFARITRASVLSVREEVYVRAAVSIGAPDREIIARHILPNVAGPIIVQTSLSFGFAILTEAALSFLGLGVQPPQPSWGAMLFDARGFVQQAWWMAVFPGLAIVLTVLSFNLVGDALRDVLDPRRRTQLEAGARS
jgi:peptide/nickel transport system permease protein